MKIDGRAIAKEINEATRESVNNLSYTPRLVIIQAGNNPVTESFLGIKQKVADAVGVEVSVEAIDADADEEEVYRVVHTVVHDTSVDSVVVQLPLPEHVNADTVLNTLTPEKDPDVLGQGAREQRLVLAPVAGAVKEVLERNSIRYKELQVLVVGQGRLVGAPVTAWLKGEGVEPIVADEYTDNLKECTQKADIIIAGAGVPHLITAHMIKDQAVLIDAGTSSDGGVLKGDIDPLCYEKALLYTPVPGGIGPITVAKLFQNIATLAE